MHKSVTPAVAHAQGFEADARTRLSQAGASDQTVRALVSRAFALFANGDAPDLDAALDQAVAEMGGPLADAWALDNNRAEVLGALDDQEPDVSNPTAADPAKQIEVQAQKLRKDHPELSEAQARTLVLKAQPALYAAATSQASGAPVLDEGMGTVAEYVDEALAALHKRPDAGVPLAQASHGLCADQPQLAQLAELVRCYPADAAHGIVEASARLRKRRPDLDVVALIGACVADPEVVVRAAKPRR
jgi:hypothetical protein